MLHSNFVDEHRGLSPVSEAGFRHQLVLVPSTVVYFITENRRNMGKKYVQLSIFTGHEEKRVVFLDERSSASSGQHMTLHVSTSFVFVWEDEYNW